MHVNCEFCDSSLDALTGKCPSCDVLLDEDPNLPGFVDGEYVTDDELEPVYEVSDEPDPLE